MDKLFQKLLDDDSNKVEKVKSEEIQNKYSEEKITMKEL